MMKMFIWTLLVAYLSFQACSPKVSTESKAASQMSNISSMQDDSSVLVHNYTNGVAEQIELVPSAQVSLREHVLHMFTQSETTRYYIEDEEIRSVLKSMNGFRIMFEPHLNSSTDSGKVTGIYYLSSGDFAWNKDGENILFLAEIDGELIQSPFIAYDQMDAMMEILIILKE